MNEKERKAKLECLGKNHPDRLLTYKEFNTKEQLFEMIKEARSKGYTILPADGDIDENGNPTEGIVLFKEIDGIELAYNPRWPVGMFCYDTKTILAQSRCNEFYMDDVGSIALKATELIRSELAKYGIKLEEKEEDLFYTPIFHELENFSNGNYKSEM